MTGVRDDASECVAMAGYRDSILGGAGWSGLGLTATDGGEGCEGCTPYSNYGMYIGDVETEHRDGARSATCGDVDWIGYSETGGNPKPSPTPCRISQKSHLQLFRVGAWRFVPSITPDIKSTVFATICLCVFSAVASSNCSHLVDKPCSLEGQWSC